MEKQLSERGEFLKRWHSGQTGLHPAAQKGTFRNETTTNSYKGEHQMANAADEKTVTQVMAQASPHGVLDNDFTHHVSRALQHFAETDTPIRVYDTELVGVVEHGPLVMVTHRLAIGDEEFETLPEHAHLFVVGVYTPHDGALSTTIYGIDGAVTFDSADELFGAKGASNG